MRTSRYNCDGCGREFTRKADEERCERCEGQADGYAQGIQRGAVTALANAAADALAVGLTREQIHAIVDDPAAA